MTPAQLMAAARHLAESHRKIIPMSEGAFRHQSLQLERTGNWIGLARHLSEHRTNAGKWVVVSVLPDGRHAVSISEDGATAFRFIRMQRWNVQNYVARKGIILMQPKDETL